LLELRNSFILAEAERQSGVSPRMYASWTFFPKLTS
jgi:hypothetical protein